MFPVNFAIFLRVPFLTYDLQWLLLQNSSTDHHAAFNIHDQTRSLTQTWFQQLPHRNYLWGHGQVDHFLQKNVGRD